MIPVILIKIVKKQSSWTQADLYESVFTLRMILATVIGVMFGLGNMEGLYAFLTYVTWRCPSLLWWLSVCF
jgi:hypothetical protein